MLSLPRHQGVAALHPHRRRAGADRHRRLGILPHQIAVIGDQRRPGSRFRPGSNIYHRSGVDQRGGALLHQEAPSGGQSDDLPVGPRPPLKGVAVIAAPASAAPCNGAVDGVQGVQRVVIGLLKGFPRRLLPRLDSLGKKGVLKIAQRDQAVSRRGGVGPCRQHRKSQHKPQRAKIFFHWFSSC